MRKLFASFSGQKYEFAKKWAIKIVRPQWLYDSVEKGHCCDAVKYKVEETSGSGEGDGQRTSTPNRGSEGLCEYIFGVYFDYSMSLLLKCSAAKKSFYISVN